MKLKLIVATVLMFVVNGFAMAQGSTDDGADIALEEVVVTGVRLQNQRAIDAKRARVEISDGIAADDIGRAPDFNVSDSFRRIAGIVTIPDEDEGEFVSVRGINPDLTYVTLDNSVVAAAGPGSGRAVPLDLFPSAVVGGLEVIKSRTPEIDGNTIGGQVNLRTRSAFDSREPFGVATLLIGEFDGDGAPFGNNDGSGSNDPTYRFDAAFSNTFGSDDQFGFVLAGSYFDKDRDEERIIPIGYTSSTGDLLDPSASFAPDFTIWSTYANPLQRIGIVAKGEFQPNDRLSMSLQGYYFDQDDASRRESELLLGGTPTFTSQFSGSVTGANFFLGHDQFVVDTENTGFQYVLDYAADNGWEFGFNASTSNGDARNGSEPDIDFNGHLIDYTYQIIDGTPQITFVDPATALDPANFPLRRFRENITETFNDASEFAFDFGKGYLDEGVGFQGGVKFRTIEQSSTFIRDAFNYDGGVATLADFIEPTDYSVLFRPGVSSLFVNAGSVRNFVDSNPGEFTFVPGTLAENYEVTEDVFAAYAAVSYVSENYEIVAGVRYEDTDVDSRTGSETQTGGYDNFLPSILWSYNFTDELRLRVSYAKAVGRPNIGDLLIAVVEDPSAMPIVIRGGNPNLEARESDNLDVSLEYYFGDGSNLLSFAVFDKDIDNDIFGTSTLGTFNGEPAIFNQPQNVESSSLTGFEIGIVIDSFDALPAPLNGLGFSGNYTFVSAEQSTPDGGADLGFLFLQPEESYNAALFYQYGGFEGQLSYNFRGSFHEAFAGDVGNSDIFADYDTLDLTMRYDLTDHVTLRGEFRNINGERNVRRTGANGILLNDESDFGKSYFIGATYRF